MFILVLCAAGYTGFSLLVTGAMLWLLQWCCCLLLENTLLDHWNVESLWLLAKIG